MGIKKIIWVFKRHPFLYLTRIRLLSYNTTEDGIEGLSYNKFNNKADIPKYYFTVNDKIFSPNEKLGDLDKVIKLSNWLRTNIKGGPGLSETSETALKLMLDGKGGVCSDIVQVFNNFCVINDISVREWGVVRAPFDRAYGGHSFNEVYSKELNKWIFIDVSWNVMFYHKNETPLSVLEFYKLFKKGEKLIYKSYSEKQLFEDANIRNNYLHKDTIPFLINKYSNKTYDAYLRRFKSILPVFAIHFFLFVIGKSYQYKFPLDNYKSIFS